MNSGHDSEDGFEEAVRRVSYRLTFGKTAEPRHWTRSSLEGPGIPNAFGSGMSSGEWTQLPHFAVYGAKALESAPQEDWLAHLLSCAVNEAVHEALEHFQVDGRPYLDPHGGNEEVIYTLVSELAMQLADLAQGKYRD